VVVIVRILPFVLGALLVIAICYGPRFVSAYRDNKAGNRDD
jgi:hypothetical protein